MSYTDRGIELALDGVIQLLKFEIDNRATYKEIVGLRRAIEIAEELKQILLKDAIECVEQ